ncbi:MAG: SPASM domain-containing protein, partial [Pseudonocardiaceae bacterium]
DLLDLGVSSIGYDRLRQLGRGVRDEQESAAQLCGACGDGVAAVGPDGSVTPCVMARRQKLGNVHDTSLAELVGHLPSARTALIEQGMPTDVPGGCRPGGGGGNCYPENEALAPAARDLRAV